MKFILKYFFSLKSTVLLIWLLVILSLKAQDTKFTVVLDAGHGGHDPGAKGAISREKDINLAITLDLGSIIEQNFKDVKVIYTRKTDKYLTLQERADVVNDHHAELFICIHTNASPSPLAFGAETYTLGLAKTKGNLDVAMRENSVILLEEDYKTKYKGFDPNSVDSYIMFEFMQDKYIDKSIDFSSAIQKQFVSYSHRSDRGVRQAGFWVLHRSACPSVLVEVGFISNSSEERFLTSETGQKEMATAIFNAFVDYKRMHDKKSGKQISQVSKVQKNLKADSEKNITEGETIKSSNSLKIQNIQITKDTIDTTSKYTKPILANELKIANKLVFKIQLFASKKALKSNAPDFKGITQTNCFIENGLNKYTLGSDSNYSAIEKIRKTILAKFPEAFIIAFIGEKKISAKEALKLQKN
jgi:N-acetylmuramoyl-L-alanine amidase